MSTREVYLEGTPPWGFRMNGGADAGHPLRISRVNPGSKAESKGVREGDLLTSINGQSTKCLTNSDSHALLRTVKENLRLGLNEDKNSSPRRRSKEIKSTSSSATDKDQSQENQQSKGSTSLESVKPSSSKARRQRKAKLKMKLKELLGYRETKGHVINMHPHVNGDGFDKLHANSDGQASIKSDTNSDNSSAVVYDNYQEYVNSKGSTLEREQFIYNNNNNTEQKENLYCNRSVEACRSFQRSCSTSNISNSSGSRPGSPIPVIVPIDEPKTATLTILKHNVHHATINQSSEEISLKSDQKPNECKDEEINERKLKEIKPDIITVCQTVEEKKTVEESKSKSKQPEPVKILVTPSEENKLKCIQANVIVHHHPDDVCEEYVKFLPPNDVTELSVTLNPISEDYELNVSDLHTPLITNTEEKQLRTFLETLNLNTPEDIHTEEVNIIYPTYTIEPQMYYYMPKRHLDVISEETSDLSDADKPANNRNDNVKPNQNVECVREDWDCNTGGIDTSWRNGKSLEEVSDVLIVSDSHSDSDVLIDEGKLFKNGKLNKTPVKKEENNANQLLLQSRKIYKNVTPPIINHSAILTDRITRKPPYEKPVPSVAIVKNVVSSYYNSKYVSEQVNIKSLKEVQVAKIPASKAITDNDVEIVYIDSSDSETISPNSINSSFSSIKSQTLDNEETPCNKTDNKTEHNEMEDNLSIKNIICDINQAVKEMTVVSIADKPSDKNNIKQQSSLVSDKQEDAIFNCNSLPDRRFSYPMSKNEVEIPKEKTRYIDNEECSNIFSSHSSESFSSQSTARHYFLSQVLSLKELCSNIILSLPNGLEILKQLGIDYFDLDQYSGYIPEGSECSTLSRHPTSEKELKMLNEDVDENEVSFSQDFPPLSEHLDNKVETDELINQNLPEDWVGVKITENPQLVVCLSPSQLKQIPPTNLEAFELLDLHKKFIERRGYHEKSPLLVKPNEKDKIALEEETDDQFKALKKYHESRQEKMKIKKKHDVEVIKYKDENQNVKRKSEQINSNSDKDEPVLVYNVTPKKDVTNKINDKDNVREDNEVGTSRLLELIQNLEPESSVSKRCTDISYPQLIIVPKETISNNQTEDIKGKAKLSDSGVTTKISIEKKTNEKSVVESKINNNKIDGKQEKIRPKSLPSARDVFSPKMYEEYMDKLAALAERRQMKIIRISPSSSVTVTNNMHEIGQLESEFMDKVKERMNKLGLTLDDDNGNLTKNNSENKSKEPLPKHLQELMEITEECGGVWSPVLTPETERKKFDFTGETKREKPKLPNVETEPPPAVWTPKSAGASPTFERKYKAVNFQSPPSKRKELASPRDEPELPEDLPAESPTRLVTSASENSTLSSQLRLPPAQNPTITLLQKAREGQIPKGAQYLQESEINESVGIRQDEILYNIKKEYTTAEDDYIKKIVELTPRKFEGIGPITKEGIPIVLRSEIKEDNQQRWYKRMYDSLHKADHDKDFVTVRYKTKRRGQYPYSYAGGYASEPERLGYDSDISVSKYATLDRRKIRNKENDFTTSTMPRNKYSPAVKHALDIYKNQPGKIEDYEPGHSSIADKETKEWWDGVLDIFDGELSQQSKSQYSTPRGGRPFTYALKDTGYESDSTLIFKRRDNMNQLSPSEHKMAYKVIQRGGDVPLHGLRKAAPERPKEPLGNPIPTPPRDNISRPHSQESPHRYVESEVNIHYRSPVRCEAKAVWPEEELAERQAEIMRRIYQEQRRTKYLNELHDMYSRRHTDNFIPSQKSPIPLNRYDDFPLETQPPRPRDRTPEPKLVARALYNFVGQTSRELSFRRGDIIYVRRQIDKNWYEGEHNAMIGLFPFNYVEIIPYDGIRTLPKKANEGQARAKFNFQAQTHLELSLVKGELVLLTRRVDENWFEGRIGSRKGIFPVSYVEVLVEPGERPMSPAGPISTKPIVAPASHSVMLNGAKDLGQQHYQPPRPALYSSSSLPAQSKIGDISLVSQTLHIDTQSDPVPYRVLYNYKPQNDDELELKEGDVVYVMEKCDDGWYVGSLHRNGQFGTFPGNYVERIQ